MRVLLTFVLVMVFRFKIVILGQLLEKIVMLGPFLGTIVILGLFSATVVMLGAILEKLLC